MLSRTMVIINHRSSGISKNCTRAQKYRCRSTVVLSAVGNHCSPNIYEKRDVAKQEISTTYRSNISSLKRYVTESLFFCNIPFLSFSYHIGICSNVSILFDDSDLEYTLNPLKLLHSRLCNWGVNIQQRICIISSALVGHI